MNAVDSSLFDTLSARLATELAQLADKPEDTPDATLRALWLLAAGRPLSAAAAAEVTVLPALDRDGEARLQAFVARRLRGVPLAYLSGRQRFLDLEMIASPAALVPRRETELLARASIARARTLSPGAIAIDVCTGAGNVALALAKQVPALRVLASDLSADAIALARDNAALLGLSERVTFHTGDLLAPFDTPEFHGRVDLLTCNPPYVSSGKVDAMAKEIASHEPALAFDGGPLGVTLLMRLLQDAPRLLRPHGWIAFEVGLGQGPAMARRLQASPHWQDIEPVTDGDGAIRAVIARRSTI